MSHLPSLYRLPDMDTPWGKFGGEPWVFSDGRGAFGRGFTPTCAFRDMLSIRAWLDRHFRE